MKYPHQRFGQRIGSWVGLWTAIGAVVLSTVSIPAFAADSAVVLMYHRFGESRYPSTNITLEQFEAHLKELKEGAYAVLPLRRIVDDINAGRPLPDRTVGLTIDDAYLSVFTEAWPRLREAGFPFTVFVSTDPVDRKVKGHMTWDQLREMVKGGVAIGGHSVSHGHMTHSGSESNDQELEKANGRYESELGRKPEIFAYPYGEAGLSVMDSVKKSGAIAAFGQHSGVLHKTSNILYMPRFALNEKYGGMDRFRLIANAMAFPAKDVTPIDPLITPGTNPPAVGFTVADGFYPKTGLRCFASHEGKVHVERLGETRIEIRLKERLPVGRTRINCTAPGPKGRWRWYGRQFYVPPN